MYSCSHTPLTTILRIEGSVHLDGHGMLSSYIWQKLQMALWLQINCCSKKHGRSNLIRWSANSPLICNTYSKIRFLYSVTTIFSIRKILNFLARWLVHRLHLWTPDRTKPRTAGSNPRAGPALSQMLDWRPPEVPSSLNDLKILQ